MSPLPLERLRDLAEEESVVRRYLTAIVLVAAALAVWYLGVRRVFVSPYFLYLVTVAFSSWLAGGGPALLATACGVVASNFAYGMSDNYDLSFPRGIVQTVIFVAVSLIIIRLNDERIALLRAERRTRIQQERLNAEWEAMMGQMGEAVLITDAAGTVRYLNAAARRMMGLEVVAPGASIADVVQDVHLYERDGVMIPSADVSLVRAARGETITNLERIVERPDGTRLTVVINARQVRDPSGEVLGAVATMRDITVERELEEEKVVILAAVAHDIKSPLSTIKGVANLLQRRVERMNLDDDGRATLTGALQSIDAKSDQILGLIEAFMAASSQGEPGQSLNIGEVGVNDLVRSAVAPLQAATETHTFRVETLADEVRARWDGDLIARAVDNLLSNAVKYSPGGGEIGVSVRLESMNGQEGVLLQVQDEGVGIPQSQQRRLFQRYFRARNAQSFSGTGLGLAGVKRVVDAHGGQISVVSREGQGTSVQVRLPLRVAGGADSAHAHPHS